MKRFPRLMIASILTAAMLVIPGMLAAAKELSTLTVRGPGINGTLALTSQAGLMQLQQYGFFGTVSDTSTLANVPQNLGEGYQVAGYLNLDGTPVPFVQAVYYPAIAGSQGYMHFTGGFDTATMKPTRTDRWAVVSAQGAAAFSSMLAVQGVTVQTAVGVPALHASLPAPAALPSGMLLALLAGAMVTLLAAGFWVKAHQASY